MRNDSRGTQRGRILELLLKARGDWVPLPKIAECAAQYNARIFELRRLGFRIPAPRIETVNGQRHSWYRLDPFKARPEQQPFPPAKSETGTLFPVNDSRPYRDPEEGALR